MKNVWKRTLSLMLSGVLLLGSVPMGAFATEQTQDPTELVEEIQPTAETQPVVAVVKDEVANAGGSALPVNVSGDVSSDWLTSAYKAEGNMLILNGENLSSVVCTEENSVLVIELKADTTIEGTLSAKKGIQIIGEGILTVGNIDAGENLEIVDAVVNVVGIEGEEKTLIKVYNTIDVSGAAHLFTADVGNAVGILESSQAGNPAVCIIKGEGYYRNSSDGEFKEITMDSAEQTIHVPVDYFEFVGKNHLSQNYNVKTITEHYRTCADEG